MRPRLALVHAPAPLARLGSPSRKVGIDLWLFAESAALQGRP